MAASASIPASSSPRTIAIVLFRNDLRLHDNPTIAAAAAACASSRSNATAILPLYILDPAFYPTTTYPPPTTWHRAFPRCGPHRARFHRECVRALDDGLGGKLRLLAGRPADVLPPLIAGLRELRHRISGVFMQREVTHEEVQVEAQLEKCLARLDVPLKRVWGSTLVHLDDLPFQGGVAGLPDVFTQFRKAVESEGEGLVRACVEDEKG
ncbi:hypothetical protein HK101_003358, partial [Irineochytrium annulatum]